MKQSLITKKYYLIKIIESIIFPQSPASTAIEHTTAITDPLEWYPATTSPLTTDTTSNASTEFSCLLHGRRKKEEKFASHSSFSQWKKTANTARLTVCSFGTG